MVPFQQLHGAATRVGASDTAFAHRYDHYNCIPTSIWLDPADNDKNIQWARRYFDAMQPYATGRYANDLGEYELDASAAGAAEGLAAAYGPETRERLVALKNKYDPSNVFRLNANIQPSR